jgi:hypothetical protein
MVMRELTSGEAEACRQKGVTKANKFLEKLEGLSEAERFERIRERFKAVWNCTNACAENFERQKFEERENGKKPQGELAILICGNIQGVAEMKTLCGEMNKSPLARVNGTSFEFAACSELTAREESKLPTAIDVYHTAVPPRASTAFESKLTCIACSIASFFLVFEDVIAA